MTAFFENFFHEKRFRVVAAVLVLLVLPLIPVLVRAGWPENHDHLQWKFMTQVYAAHWASGNWFPVWSTEDRFGLGSAFPLFYHKLFFLFSGALYALTAAMKFSIVTTLVFFLSVGAWGIAAAARTMGLSLWPSVFLGAGLGFQEYTVTDWLIRGAFSEFAACMLVPWLFWIALRWMKEGEIPRATWVILLAMALSHSVIAYVGLFFLLPAVGMAAYTHRNHFWKKSFRSSIVQALLVVGALSYYAVPWWRLREQFDLGILNSSSNHPSNNFFHFPKQYLWNSYYRWGKDWRDLCLELSWVLLAFLIGTFFYYRRNRSFFSEALPADSRRVGRYLFGSLVVGLFLLWKPSSFIYEWVPGLTFIQFPYRLLGYVQVLLLLNLAFLLRQIENRLRGRIVVAGLSLGFVLASLVATKSLRPIQYEWFTKAQLEAEGKPGREVGLPVPEYLPRMKSEASFEEKQRQMKAWAEAGPQSEPACRVQNFGERKFEDRVRRFEVNCDKDATVILPLLFTGVESVQVSDGQAFKAAPTFRLPEDPRLRLKISATTKWIEVRYF